MESTGPNKEPKIREALLSLAGRLHERRDAVLSSWQTAVRADPVLTSGLNLPRIQFVDHIPALLDAFEEVLRAWGKSDANAAARQEDVRAAQHGLERWRQGYQLFEVIREWRHLQIALVVEVENQARGLDPDAMSVARRLLAELCADGVCESAERYFTLQRAEAHSRLMELELAQKNYEANERARADAWREAAHDLRGNLGVVTTATAVLTAAGLADSTRSKSLGILNRGVESMHSLLDELISLARLEAGRDVRQLQSFNAAELLAGLCGTMTQVAETRGLKLTYEGPPSLPVRGDPMKVRRIAQNLLINALTYTIQGDVILSCVDGPTERWTLRVTDSGPGFPAGVDLGSPALSVAETKAAPVSDGELAHPNLAETGSELTFKAMGGSETGRTRGGEGIGLSIVKRLCELLDATIELSSERGLGSSFFVIFPKDYEA